MRKTHKHQHAVPHHPHVGCSLIFSGVPQGFMPQQLTVGGQFDKTDAKIKPAPIHGQQVLPVYHRTLVEISQKIDIPLRIRHSTLDFTYGSVSTRCIALHPIEILCLCWNTHPKQKHKGNKYLVSFHSLSISKG